MDLVYPIESLSDSKNSWRENRKRPNIFGLASLPEGSNKFVSFHVYSTHSGSRRDWWPLLIERQTNILRTKVATGRLVPIKDILNV